MGQISPPAPTVPSSLTYSCLIPHPTARQLLFVPHAQGWALPWWSHEDGDQPFWQTVGGVSRALREHFGLDTPILRCVHVGHGPQRWRSECIYESEPPPPAWALPPGGRWFGRDDLGRIPLADPTHRALLDRWFSETGDAAVIARRPPWYRPGWFAEATDWLEAQLARRGYTIIAPPEQLRSWERSCLLRALTAEGWVYVKAVPTIFAHEPPLTYALAQAYHGAIPTLLAHDDTRRWMVMADFGGVSLASVRESGRWAAALRRFAEIQIACIPRVSVLCTLGCPARSMSALPTGLDTLLADPAALLFETPEGLTVAEIDTLRAHAPFLATWCAELAYAPIPETLEHGDFWAGNVAATATDYVYFDWSDSAIAHPFFSLALFLADAARTFSDDPGIEIRLRDAYLAPWTAFAPQSELVRVFALAQRLAPLHHAITYHRDILPAMDARWEMERMVPHYLRMLLPPAPKGARAAEGTLFK